MIISECTIYDVHIAGEYPDSEAEDDGSESDENDYQRAGDEDMGCTPTTSKENLVNNSGSFGSPIPQKNR